MTISLCVVAQLSDDFYGDRNKNQLVEMGLKLLRTFSCVVHCGCSLKPHCFVDVKKPTPDTRVSPTRLDDEPAAKKLKYAIDHMKLILLGSLSMFL